MGALKSLYLDFLAWRKFGRARPASVLLPGACSPVHLNPADRRAVKKLVHDGARGRVSVPAAFWRDAVAHLQPDVALDVGANYGECFASTRYPAHTRVVAVEANPTLMDCLQRTRDAHPDAARLRLVNCLVSDHPAAAEPFFFEPDWTGGGSAIPPAAGAQAVRVDVAQDTLDHLLEAEAAAGMDALVFKADIEGYEGRMLRGFRRLAGCRRVLGILEFDTLYLERAGTPAREVFQGLAASFQVFKAARRGRVLQAVPTWEALVQAAGRPRFHVDLVVSTSRAELPPGWRVSEPGAR